MLEGLVAAAGAASVQVGPRSFFSAVAREVWRDGTLFLFAGLVAAAGLRRAFGRRGKNRQLRTTTVLLLAHLVTLPVLGLLKSQGAKAFTNVRLLSLAFATLAAINLISFLLFDWLLRLLRIMAPRILVDILTAAAYAVAAVVLLSRTGVNLSGLIATSAVLTAVIGFSLQDTLGNIMGGLALQLENTVQPGDWIKVNDFVGRVIEVRWRQTSIETRNWETVIFPNSMLMKTQIVVLGRRLGEPVQLRRQLFFNVDFRHEPTDVIRIVNEAMQRAPIANAAAEPKPNCVLIEVTDSSCRYQARYWLTDIARDDPTDSEVRTRIYFALQRAGMSFSIPAHAVFLTQETEDRRRRKEGADMEKRREALHRVELFNGLAEEELDEVAEGLRYAPFAPSEPLCRQGDQGHHLYVIVEGTVAVRVTSGGREREVATLGPGQFFGERSLMTGEPRSATVIAVTDVVCYRLDKAEFAAVLKRRPELAAQAADVLARRQAELQSVREDLDQAAQETKLAESARLTLASIKSFFGL